jgi:amidase
MADEVNAGAPRSIHAFDDELARLDAVATADLVRSGELQPREVIESAIERVRTLEPHLNAVEAADFERALDAAESVAPVVPFAAVPTFIKDMVDVAGLPTRWGTRALDEAGPKKKTEPLAAQMFDMGMISLGKSTMPEIGFAPSTEFPHREPTRNPWNLDRSAGGSSGGAAALVAAGAVPIAHAADGGGSIRIPAVVCGLVGLKPSRGRLVPPPGPNLEPVQTTVHGVVTRSVRDTALYYAEAEKRYRNPRLKPVGRVMTPLRRRLRIGAFTESPGGHPTDVATRHAFDATIALLEELGHRVEPMAAPVDAGFAEDFVLLYGLYGYVVSRHGGRLFDPAFDGTKLTDLTRGLAEQFRRNLRKAPGAILRLRRSPRRYAEIFRDCDVVLTPTLSHLTPRLGHLGLDLPFETLFPRILEWLGFTPLANATGAPAISLPLGFDVATNLPIGMMFSAALGDEALLLELALELEDARPWPALARHAFP